MEPQNHAFFSFSLFHQNLYITYTSGKFLRILFSSLRSPTILPCLDVHFLILLFPFLPTDVLQSPSPHQIMLMYYSSLLADFHFQYLFLLSYPQKIASRLLRQLLSLHTPSRLFSYSILIMVLYPKNLQWWPLFYCIKSKLLFLVSSPAFPSYESISFVFPTISDIDTFLQLHLSIQTIVPKTCGCYS